jgi:phage terminase large subunit-like protein
VIRTARPRTPFKEVRATRGKVVRAEPFSSLYESGKVRHVGTFVDLEGELCAMTQYGYTAQGSPNRADAWIWVLAEIFPHLTKPEKEMTEEKPRRRRFAKRGWYAPSADWMEA